ncbi:serine/threonine-protein kinase [Rhodopirellula sp. JC639]|uniref:serine/threonine-protein kinase n=1 Tax=Stieleria mannarensis TaxID=2755585 RepID=UPI0016003195|nr:serine/threonine-protein kinase [Rhodopirellula sp. JC639]
MVHAKQMRKGEQIFIRALDFEDPVERDRYLDEMCADQPSLHREVKELLAADEREDSILDGCAVLDATSTEEAFDHRLEAEIGRYKILQEIGEGGFGVVYMAEQTEPVRRKVALKVIKPGMDSRLVVARFEAERQALAMMDHPNIARVLDGGTTESGYPYFVMDLVRGLPITEFCDEETLSTKERLNLFNDLCNAIQHAHQKGVIHRDIKPSNVLVSLHDGKPVVKVIDFGIAKALHGPLTDTTSFTSFGAIVGTPQYMSPEQTSISGLDVDTRSDLYSMGILLYELLTGQTPLARERFRSAGVDEIRHLIRSIEPRRPSALVDTLDEATVTRVAKLRRVPSPTFRRILRGDLDWIVMKAIEKDRNRRYASATELAEDLQNHLEGNAVSACPPTLGYKAQKLIRKHKGKCAFAASILALLFGYTVSLSRGYATEKRLNRQLIQSRNDFLSKVLDSILTAKGRGLEQAIADLQPLRNAAVPRLKDRMTEQTPGSYQWVNTTIALTALNPAEKLGDHLLENIDRLESDLCPSLVSMLRTTNYNASLLAGHARKAKLKRDLGSKVRIAVLGLYIGDHEIAKEMLRFGIDPIQRTEFLYHFPKWHADLNELAELAAKSDEPDFRSGLIQAIGLVEMERDVTAFRKRWAPQLQKWYEDAPDLLTRNSAEWLLRRWGEKLPKPQSASPRETHDWFVNSAGIAMRRITPGTFTMGDWEGNTRIKGNSVEHEEPIRRVQITQPFFVADREVTAQQYLQCDREEGLLPCRYLSGQTPYPNWNWIRAAVFCNWLSKKEGLEACYRLDVDETYPVFG